MKEVGVFFSGLVLELAGLREAAVKGLNSLQAEQDELEDKIRQAQERHQTVRDAKRTDAKRKRKPLSELVNSSFFPQSTLTDITEQTWLFFLLTGYEADHPVPAGPAQPAVHGGGEGFH